MFIRKLELSGFKSFVTKTCLEFTPRLTAIIGPNGSGKSNLVDAVKWVLGEHNSHSLRAGRMEEIIFNGSKKLRPLGRAEVSLTVDNTDGLFPLAYPEIRLTRRLFRSGEGEYFLNQAPCRLRDIQRLLWDTGVGKQGFAIISQGRVEEMVAASPEERRGFLEEVAGIVRYHSRRREAGQRLSETAGHLVRIRDIIAEQESRLTLLEHEVTVAKQFQAVQEEIDSIEKILGFGRLRALSLHRQKLASRLADLESRLAEVENRCGMLEGEIEDARLTVAGMANRREAGNSHRDETAALKREAELKLEAESREALFLSAEKEKLDGELEELEQAHRQVEEKLARAEKELQELSLEQQRLAERNSENAGVLAAVEKELTGSRKTQEECRSKLHEVWQEILATQNQLRVLDKEWQESKAKGQRLHSEWRNLQEGKEAVAGELVETGKRVGKACEHLAGLESQLISLNEKVLTYRQELSDLRSDLEETLQQWQRDRDRLVVLKEWQENHEGYGQGVRAVLRARQSLAKGSDHSGILGVVAEMLRVPPDLEAAVEASLGGAMQHIITRTEVDAQKAISYLKASGMGRATFLPLDAIRPRRLAADRSVLTWTGVIGIGSDLVGISEECTPVLHHLLGDVLIVIKLDVALAIARRLGYRIRVVTAEGELLHPGGSLTGGSRRGRNGGLLYRRREMAALAERVEEENQRVGACQEKNRSLGARLGALEQEKHQLEEQVRDARTTVNEGEKETRELMRRQALLEERLAVVGLDVKKWEEEFQYPTRTRELLEAKLSALERDKEMLEAEESGTDGLREAETRRRECLALVEDGRKEMAVLHQRQERLLGGMAGLKQMKDRHERDLGLRRERSMDLITRIEAKGRIREALGREVQRLALEEEACRHDLEAVETPWAAAVASLKEKEIEINRMVAKKKALERDYSQVRYQAGEQEANWRAQVDWMGRRYGWKETDGLPELTGTIGTEEELSRRLSDRKLEAERMGDVDLSVLSEYNRLLDRHQYLCRQAADLEEAEASLNKVVAEVEKLMEERLSTALEAVNKELGQVFPALFGGGKAWLAATGGGRLQDGGLELVVQIPGKRMLSLALLSGGERALAAIAVLFSFLKVKPSPFCLLDEIDASLDEGNVERFAHFLNLMAVNQQFIIVSHRAGTVEQVDNLYGVTMEEQGVSRLVSLRLARQENRACDSVG